MVGRLPEQLIEAVPMGEEERRTLFMMCSLLLDYPGPEFPARLAAVREQLGCVEQTVRADIRAFLDEAHARGHRGMETHYVETFDQRRRCSLYLSYYAVGDTRQRGSAILAFQHSLYALGYELEREELPDHLAVLLEAAAHAHGELHAQATELIAAHRDGVEVLRAALEQLHSPYLHLVRALCRALPPIDEDTVEAYLQLIRSGPPTELVGLGTPLPYPTHLKDHHVSP
ncbi:nitrate reductase molybdenum cofactor assembly chaperone [Corynebacterium uropygiale]|uniref:Nitrate reductase molybdenum cofactor assembly chaperone n=1 Tax=Corynebacterium uropygiale TaxID=1775911 RepID=A0A9X1QP11_9CORY|nr:nitrate reductase molybdenum cofactor assembly chaperone [Corynebacterium uropygiale]MCF4006942.1 nitrate reductase molybdenum cofactor assembly chaperone [Corynebacterium uropygiale]